MRKPASTRAAPDGATDGWVGLPREVRRDIEDRYCYALVRLALEFVAGSRNARVDAQSRLLYGALTDAARAIGESDDVAAARREMGRAVADLLDGLAASGSGTGIGSSNPGGQTT